MREFVLIIGVGMSRGVRGTLNDYRANGCDQMVFDIKCQMSNFDNHVAVLKSGTAWALKYRTGTMHSVDKVAGCVYLP